MNFSIHAKGKYNGLLLVEKQGITNIEQHSAKPRFANLLSCRKRFQARTETYFRKDQSCLKK